MPARREAQLRRPVTTWSHPLPIALAADPIDSVNFELNVSVYIILAEISESPVCLPRRSRSPYPFPLATPNTICRTPSPRQTNSGETLPLTKQYPFGFSVERPVIVHHFGTLGAKQEQRYYLGIGRASFSSSAEPQLGRAKGRASIRLFRGPTRSMRSCYKNEREHR
jgi:hypothetical protein